MPKTASAVGRLTFVAAAAAISVGAWNFAYQDNTGSAPPLASTLEQMLATVVEVWPLAAILVLGLAYIAGVSNR